ncbi:unnamed protein product [Somion occarium]
MDGMQQIISLTNTGEVIDHFAEDVHFSIPDYVDKDLITRCTIEFIAENEHQIAARVRALKKIRELERRIEVEFNRIAPLMNNAYDTFKSSNPSEWAHATTSQIATLVGPVESLSPVTIIAVHKHIMQRSVHFVANQSQFLATHLFWIRPQEQIDDLAVVEDMVHRKDPLLDAFAAKARQLILRNREILTSTSSLPPAVKPQPDIQFTDQEKVIVRFLKAVLRSQRSTQKDPYIVPSSFILKKIAYQQPSEDLVHFELIGIDDATISRFLVDLGVLTAWDDPNTGKNELHFLHEKGLEQQITSVTCAVDPSLRSLGPTDLYPKDIVESLRHDFGNLPAYIVDDVGAEELDDALSVEPVAGDPSSYWIHVHIADPTSILPPTHEVAQQAHRQTTSLYFIHQTLPMLPKDSVFEALSLGSGRDSGRPDKTLSFSFKLDHAGEIVDYKVRAGLIRNTHIVKYNEMDAALGLPRSNLYSYPFPGTERDISLRTFPKSDVTNMRTLHFLAKRLLDARLRTDALSTHVRDVEITMSPRPPPSNPFDVSQPIQSIGFPTLDYRVRDENSEFLDSRGVISEMMKTASRVASRFFRDHNIPAIRRSAGRMTTASEETFGDLLAIRDPMGNIPYVDLVRANGVFPAAQYTTKINGHWQLGIPDGEGYTRVTSPLRRYADIVAHWQIKHALVSPASAPFFSEDWMNTFIVEFSAKEARLRKIELWHRANWAVKFLKRWIAHPENHKDVEDPLQSLTCVVVAATTEDRITRSFHTQVLLPEIGLRGVLRGLSSGEEVQIGDVLPVKLGDLKTGLKPAIGVVRR